MHPACARGDRIDEDPSWLRPHLRVRGADADGADAQRAPSRAADLIVPDLVRVSPLRPLSVYTDSFGNICCRLVAPAGELRIVTDTVVEDSRPARCGRAGRARSIRSASCRTMRCSFLIGSRYCETDQLIGLAWSLFGNTPRGWARVQAIVDYVHRPHHLRLRHARARPAPPLEAHEERVGVCRDFAHLAITLCRCMNIPARY